MVVAAFVWLVAVVLEDPSLFSSIPIFTSAPHAPTRAFLVCLSLLDRLFTLVTAWFVRVEAKELLLAAAERAEVEDGGIVRCKVKMVWQRVAQHVCRTRARTAFSGGCDVPWMTSVN